MSKTLLTDGRMSDGISPEEGYFTTQNEISAAKLYVTCANTGQLAAAADEGIDEICLNIFDLDEKTVDEAKEYLGDDKKLIVGLPYVCRYEFLDDLKEFTGKTAEKHPDLCFMVRNYDETAIFTEFFPGIIQRAGIETDYMPYCMNSTAVLRESSRFAVSPELDVNELESFLGVPEETEVNGVPALIESRHPEKTLIIYGYQPSMISAQCVYKNITGKCLKNAGKNTTGKNTAGKTVSISSGEHVFRTKQICDTCTNIIYNSACLNNIDRIAELGKIGFDRFRLDFTFESPEQVKSVIRAAKGKLNGGGAEDTDITDILPGVKFTRGHLHRPVL